MKKWSVIVAFISSMLFMSLASGEGITGNWTTIDDKTGSKRALVRLVLSGDQLTATIVKIYPQAGDLGICAKCPGNFKNKPIQGLQFLWGLKDKGNGEWDGGQILDPKTGKVYRAKMTLKGNKLYVRGYLGISMLGRTQMWVR